MQASKIVVACSFVVVVGAALAGGAGDSDRELNALIRKVAALEKQASHLVKDVRDLEKSLALSGREAEARPKNVKTLERRSDKRTLRLGQWFDDYHGREGRSTYHRDEIRRVK